MQHSTLFLALKEAFLSWVLHNRDFSGIPGAGTGSGTGRVGGETRVSKCALAKWRSAQMITSRTLRAM